MIKSEWEEIYNQLNDLASKLAVLEREYKHGSNKKKRSDAEREMGYKMHTVRYLFRKYPEIYTLASGGDKASDFNQAIIMDEFFQNRYIVGDLETLLAKIREKINSL